MSGIPEDFTPWHGGECPIKDNKSVYNVLFRDGVKDDRCKGLARYEWRHEGAGGDIIAYRITKPHGADVTKPDLTAITQPLCFLDDETQEALKAHGGPYEFLAANGEWHDIAGPSWLGGYIYRVKPGLKREKVWRSFPLNGRPVEFTIDLIDGEPDWSSIKPVGEP